MQNIKNIQLIKKSFDCERQKFIFELNKVNVHITKRLNTIDKISAYQHEYTNKDNLSLSKSIPSLSKNIELFTQKICNIVQLEQKEIEKLERIKASITTKIASLDHKIKLMGHFSDRALALKAELIEKSDQTTLDDIAANQHLRGYHV